MIRSAGLIVCLVISFAATAQNYKAWNISMLSNWFDPAVVSEPYYGIKYNGIWGWYDPVKKREYGIIGSTAGVYIVEVTNPSVPVLRDYVPGRRDSCIWREVKTYQNYLYMVSDDGAPNSLQIADLSYLPDSVRMVHDSDSIFSRAHTIYVDGDKLYCASVKSPAGFAALAVYSLADPAKPQLLRKIEEDFTAVSGGVHDMFVRNDTVYVSWAYNGLFIFEFQSNNTFKLLGSITSYPDQGYNHSSFLTPDGKTLVFADEVPANLAVKVADVSDLSDIKIKSTFKSNEGATPHNPYLVGNKVVMAYYQDGVQIFDVEDPANPVRIGYFDTHYQSDSTYLNPVYQGCWGAYTDLPSGVLLASDMQNGLYVLDAKKILSGIVKPDKSFENGIRFYPNPFKANLEFVLTMKHSHRMTLEVRDVTGKLVYSKRFNAYAGENAKSIDVSFLAPGIYTAKVTGERISFIEKVVKVE